MDVCAGSVTLGMMVCAVSVYAPLCINAMTLSISAAAMASGRSPSKVTMRTRSILGGGVKVGVAAGVTVEGGRVLVGVMVGVGNSVAVGGGVGVEVPHEERKTRDNKVKIVMRFIVICKF
jgi:hypothetical protein